MPVSTARTAAACTEGLSHKCWPIYGDSTHVIPCDAEDENIPDQLLINKMKSAVEVNLMWHTCFRIDDNTFQLILKGGEQQKVWKLYEGVTLNDSMMLQ